MNDTGNSPRSLTLRDQVFLARLSQHLAWRLPRHERVDVLAEMHTALQDGATPATLGSPRELGRQFTADRPVRIRIFGALMGIGAALGIAALLNSSTDLSDRELRGVATGLILLGLVLGSGLVARLASAGGTVHRLGALGLVLAAILPGAMLAGALDLKVEAQLTRQPIIIDGENPRDQIIARPRQSDLLIPEGADSVYEAAIASRETPFRTMPSATFTTTIPYPVQTTGTTIPMTFVLQDAAGDEHYFTLAHLFSERRPGSVCLPNRPNNKRLCAPTSTNHLTLVNHTKRTTTQLPIELPGGTARRAMGIPVVLDGKPGKPDTVAIAMKIGSGDAETVWHLYSIDPGWSGEPSIASLGRPLSGSSIDFLAASPSAKAGSDLLIRQGPTQISWLKGGTGPKTKVSMATRLDGTLTDQRGGYILTVLESGPIMATVSRLRVTDGKPRLTRLSRHRLPGAVETVITGKLANLDGKGAPEPVLVVALRDVENVKYYAESAHRIFVPGARGGFLRRPCMVELGGMEPWMVTNPQRLKGGRERIAVVGVPQRDGLFRNAYTAYPGGATTATTWLEAFAGRCPDHSIPTGRVEFESDGATTGT